MLKNSLYAGASLAALLLGATGAQAHSVGEARDVLEDRGYYDINLERASLPYSFNACKHGRRFHIHIDYYGNTVEKDAVGWCDRYSNDDDDDYGARDRRRHGWRND